MPQDKIVIHGAREHNLKNIDVEIPRDKLVVGLENHLWPLKLYMQKVNVDMLNLCQLMLDSF